jgi:hypothetical protein
MLGTENKRDIIKEYPEKYKKSIWLKRMQKNTIYKK